ncbi:hypothetical protein HMPREF3204_00678 [Gardnerella pickettii]|nr:hypothetical protein HMPREF3204_00678 [Gardnerella pickettii]
MYKKLHIECTKNTIFVYTSFIIARCGNAMHLSEYCKVSYWRMLYIVLIWMLSCWTIVQLARVFSVWADFLSPLEWSRAR